MVDTAPLDYVIISRIIENGSKVLDLGCGTGGLMKYLSVQNNAKIQGIELNEDAIYQCVEKGLNVFHSDIDSGLGSFPDKTFNYVILNQTLQEVKKVSYVIEESLRVAEKAIIGFPNFAYIQARLMLALSGRSPVTKSLPHHWHDTPNLRFLSIKDFKEFCSAQGIHILDSFYLNGGGQVRVLPNLLAKNAVFIISK